MVEGEASELQRVEEVELRERRLGIGLRSPTVPVDVALRGLAKRQGWRASRQVAGPSVVAGQSRFAPLAEAAQIVRLPRSGSSHPWHQLAAGGSLAA